jgi:hypothetical protein
MDRQRPGLAVGEADFQLVRLFDPQNGPWTRAFEPAGLRPQGFERIAERRWLTGGAPDGEGYGNGSAAAQDCPPGRKQRHGAPV